MALGHVVVVIVVVVVTNLNITQVTYSLALARVSARRYVRKAHSP